MKKYLLSTGEVTGKIEYYILDLFRVYLTIYPGDIPGSGIGFNFIFTNVKKDEIVGEVKSRINNLVSIIKKKVEQESGRGGLRIEIEKLWLVDETTVKLVLNLNDELLDELTANIYNQ